MMLDDEIDSNDDASASTNDARQVRIVKDIAG